MSRDLLAIDLTNRCLVYLDTEEQVRNEDVTRCVHADADLVARGYPGVMHGWMWSRRAGPVVAVTCDLPACFPRGLTRLFRITAATG